MQVKDYNDGMWHLSQLEGGVHMMGGADRCGRMNGLLEVSARGSELERWWYRLE